MNDVGVLAFVISLLGATLRVATPLVYASTLYTVGRDSPTALAIAATFAP